MTMKYYMMGLIGFMYCISWINWNSRNLPNDDVFVPKDIQTDHPQLDLVFLMDCTASMGPYIKKGKESIMDIVEKVKSSEKADVRFAYIAYRDHPPQDNSLITKVHDFTRNSQDMRQYLSLYSASGGGDGPESVTEALNDALHLSYRPNAIKIVVLVADAPPHGVVPTGDGFPNGSPNGYDPIKIAKQMAEKGIILYVVACEPSLSGYVGAHDLMAGLAQITTGRYLPLTGAHLLPDAIIGGSKQEISLQKLEAFVEDKMNEIEKENPDISEDEMDVKLKEEMDTRGFTEMRNDVDDEGIYGKYDKSNIVTWANAESLSDGRKKQNVLAQPQANFDVAQKVHSYVSGISLESVSIVKTRGRRAHKKRNL